MIRQFGRESCTIWGSRSETTNSLLYKLNPNIPLIMSLRKASVLPIFFWFFEVDNYKVVSRLSSMLSFFGRDCYLSFLSRKVSMRCHISKLCCHRWMYKENGEYWHSSGKLLRHLIKSKTWTHGKERLKLGNFWRTSKVADWINSSHQKCCASQKLR